MPNDEMDVTEQAVDPQTSTVGMTASVYEAVGTKGKQL